jgi:hypothetical protein
MAIDARIPLMGTPVNAMAGFRAGAETAALTNQIGDNNRLRDVFAAQGPAVLEGNPDALAALAGAGPAGADMAMSVQSHRQGMQINEQTLRLRREQGMREAARFASEMSQAERAAEAEQLRRALSTAYPYVNEALQTGDMTRLNEFLSSVGMPTFNSPEEAIARFIEIDGFAEGLGTFQGIVNPQGEDPDSKEVEIRRLMRDNGLTREQATAIAYNVVGRDRDPVTGDPGFYDLRDMFQSQGAPSGPAMDPARPPSVFNQPNAQPAQDSETGPTVMPQEGADYRGALGAEGFVTNLVNTVSDFALGQRPFQEQGRARTALNNLRTRTLTTLSTATVPGRPSNYVMEMFNQNVVTSGGISGPEAALDTAEQTLAFLDAMVAENESILRRRVTPQTRSEIARNLEMLRGLREDYRIVVDGLQGSSGGGTNDDDAALIQRYLQ